MKSSTANASSADPLVAALETMLPHSPLLREEHGSLRPSAILLLFFFKDQEYHLLLNKRTELVEHHKREICFPGGVQEPQDADHWATALREAQEEMGIEPQDVDIIGELDPVSTRTDFLIRPVVGIFPYPYPFRVNSAEIAEVLEVPVAALLDAQNVRTESRLRPEGIEHSTSYVYQGHLIYGATARILAQFLAIWRKLYMEEPGGRTRA